MNPTVWIIVNTAAMSVLCALVVRARASHTALTLATFPLLTGVVVLAWRAGRAESVLLLPSAWLSVGGTWAATCAALAIALVRTREAPAWRSFVLPACTVLVLGLFALLGRISRLDAQLLALAGLLVYWLRADSKTDDEQQRSTLWFVCLVCVAFVSSAVACAASHDGPTDRLWWLVSPWLAVFVLPAVGRGVGDAPPRVLGLFAQTAGLGLGLGAIGYLAALVLNALDQTPTSHPLETLQVVGFVLAQDPAMPGLGRLAPTVFVVGIGVAVAMVALRSRSRIARAIGAVVLTGSVIAVFGWGIAPL